jgi:hypothetical protein
MPVQCMTSDVYQLNIDVAYWNVIERNDTADRFRQVLSLL